MDVYILKDPKLDEEKVFYNEFFSNNGLILKDYSDSFCKIVIDESLKMMKNVLID